MCGILGYFEPNPKISRERFEEALKIQGHRGPDGTNSASFDSGFLGHNRLAIIDLKDGDQPFYDHSGRYCIVFNGEIYNYRELKEILISKGYTFKSNSDTEVLLNAFAEWGSSVHDHLRGMYAFAIWDNELNRLFLARDPFGIKPLVYYQSGRIIAFASEIAPLRKLLDENELNYKALIRYLRMGYISHPETAYTNIKKLAPGASIDISFSEFSITYGENKSRTKARTFANEAENIDAVQRSLYDSVRSHTVSDVPFGAFLSGGVDSTLVVGDMTRCLENPVQTFSIGFKESGFNELPYAETASKRYKTEHLMEVVESSSLEDLRKIIDHFGEPFGDPAVLPTFYLAKLAAENVKMVLSGDGGDEFFGGYGSYLRWLSWLNLNGVSPVRKSIQLILDLVKGRDRKNLQNWLKYTPGLVYEKRRAILNPEMHQFLEQDDEFYAGWAMKNSRLDPLGFAMEFDRHFYLPDNMLYKVDVVAMMHGLEVRTPLIDKEVAKVSGRTLSSLMVRKDSSLGKVVLRKLLEKDFPTDFVYREKHGFSVPMKNWFGMETGGVDQGIRDIILDSNPLMSALFNASNLEGSLDSLSPDVIWRLLVFSFWANSN